MRLKRFLTAILALSFALPAGAKHDSTLPTVSDRARQTEDSFVILDKDNQSAIAVSRKDVAQVSDVQAVLNNLPADRSYDLVISTDSPAVLEQSVEWAAAQPEKKRPHFLPYGQLLTDNTKKVGGALAKVARNAVDAVRRDPIGLMITVVTTSMDSYMWIHSQSLGLDERVAMVMLNVVLAATFGLDKDLWTRTARAVQVRMIDVLKHFQLFGTKGEPGPAGAFATALLANVSLSVALQLTRMSVLSMPHLTESLATTHFWAASAALGLALTISGIGWSEHLANIDEEKKPITKFVFRRWMEIRSIAMSYVAPSAKIMQPDVYGLTPLILLAGHGAVGLATLFAGDRITNWIEDRESLQWIKKINSSVISDFRDRCLNILRKDAKAALVRCEVVFAN